MKTMFILAHFDDETFGLSGYIQHLKSINNEIYILYLCKGRDDANHKKRLNIIKQINTDINFNYLNYYDLTLFSSDMSKISSKIRDEIRKNKPQRIVTHCQEDLHQDHVFTSNCVRIALKRIESTSIDELLEFKSPENYPFKSVYFDSVYNLSPNEIEIKEKNVKLFKETENVPKIYTKEFFRTIYRKLK